MKQTKAKEKEETHVYETVTPDDIPEGYAFKKLVSFFPNNADYICVANRWMARNFSAANYNKIWAQTIEEMQAALVKCTTFIFDPEDTIGSTPESNVLFAICKLVTMASELNDKALDRANTVQFSAELGYKLLESNEMKHNIVRFSLVFSYLNKKTNHIMLQRLYINELPPEMIPGAKPEYKVYMIDSWEFVPVIEDDLKKATDLIHHLPMSDGFIILMNPLNFEMEVITGFPETHVDKIGEFYDSAMKSQYETIVLDNKMIDKIKAAMAAKSHGKAGII